MLRYVPILVKVPLRGVSTSAFSQLVRFKTLQTAHRNKEFMKPWTWSAPVLDSEITYETFKRSKRDVSFTKTQDLILIIHNPSRHYLPEISHVNFFSECGVPPITVSAPRESFPLGYRLWIFTEMTVISKWNVVSPPFLQHPQGQQWGEVNGVSRDKHRESHAKADRVPEGKTIIMTSRTEFRCHPSQMEAPLLHVLSHTNTHCQSEAQINQYQWY